MKQNKTKNKIWHFQENKNVNWLRTSWKTRCESTKLSTILWQSHQNYILQKWQNLQQIVAVKVDLYRLPSVFLFFVYSQNNPSQHSLIPSSVAEHDSLSSSNISYQSWIPPIFHLLTFFPSHIALSYISDPNTIGHPLLIKIHTSQGNKQTEGRPMLWIPTKPEIQSLQSDPQFCIR